MKRLVMLLWDMVLGLKAMQVRGRMQEGMVADITIFDPKTVTATARTSR